MSKDDMLAKYVAQKFSVELAKQQLEEAQESLNTTLETILKEHGKGPHDLGDGKDGGYVIACRDGRGEPNSYWFTPAKKIGSRK